MLRGFTCNIGYLHVNDRNNNLIKHLSGFKIYL